MRLIKRDLTVGLPCLLFAVALFFVSAQMMQILGVILSVWLLGIWGYYRSKVDE